MGRWANKYVIGLTGNIAMGKSVVRKMLEHLGAHTIDADGLAHQTMLPGAPAFQPVVETFGKWILGPDGKIDRSKLGAVVFSHPEALARLEAITHPLVGRGIDVLVNRAAQPVVVIEAIKLIEGALADQVDSIWVVDAAAQIQMQRLIEKRGMSEVEARKRIEGQNPQRDKLARANVVITNNGTLQDMWVQVEREWNRLVETRGLKKASDMVRDDAVRTVKLTELSTTNVPAASAVPGQSAPALPPAPKPATGPLAAPKPSTGSLPPLPGPAAPAKPKTGPLPSGAAPTEAASPTPAGTPSAQPLPQPTPQAQPAAQPQKPGEIAIDIRRGMPRNAEMIAQVISRVTGKRLTRDDVMMAFGEKSYLLAEQDNKTLGIAGFQVENLITRVDEFLLMPNVPAGPVSRALIQAFEDASKNLQSEVGFVYLPLNAPQTLVQAFADNGYERTELDAIKVPAWREAAAESQPPNTMIMAKKLRAERVLKPL